MRVFLDTKSDQLRVELAQGVVAATFTTQPKQAEKTAERGGVIEVDVAKGGEVLVLRVQGLAELFEGKLRRIEPKG